MLEHLDAHRRAGKILSLRWWLGALVAGLIAPGGAFACGGEVACTVAGGAYAIRLPDTPRARPVPVLVHLHGMGGTGAEVVASPMADRALARGYAVLAPQGDQPGSRHPRNWSVSDNRPHPRDDHAFVALVIDDAVARFGLDRARVVLSGFSRGGSMVWDIACRTPGLARAYASVAGAFWDPLPAACAGPVDLHHTHGWTDRVVPLEGRSFGNATIVQGDVFAGLFVLRAANGCAARQPETAPVAGDLWQRLWSDCAAGSLGLTLHPGGHSVPEFWIDRTLDWVEGLGPAPLN